MYYVTMKSDKRVSLLLGPFATMDEAQALVRPARDEAIRLDGYNHFNAFGVSRLQDNQPVPHQGVLNTRMGY